jgi:hypothetical protein
MIRTVFDRWARRCQLANARSLLLRALRFLRASRKITASGKTMIARVKVNRTSNAA